MNSLSILLLNHLLNKSNTYFNYEISFHAIAKSELWLHISNELNSTAALLTIDKPSYLFILMTLILTPFALMANWNSIVIFNSKNLFFSILVWTELMLIITFSTSDLFIFYLGFEGLSLPVFFLIFLFGAELTKIRASIYFLIYSLTSSTFMALSIFLFYSQSGTTNV